MKRDNRVRRVVKAGRVLKHAENQVILMTPETVGVLLTSKRDSRVKGVVMTLGGAGMLQTTDKELKDKITLKREETILDLIEHQTPMIIIVLQTTDKELRDKTTLKGRKREEIILDFIEHQISLITTGKSLLMTDRAERRKNSEKGRRKREQMITIKGEE